MEQLQQAGAGSTAPPAQGADTSDAVAYLMSALNNQWNFASGTEGMTPATQRFKPAETACTYHVFIQHPNGGKTTFEVDFSTLDANRITWPKDFFKDEKLPFLVIPTLGSREIVKEWIDYPDGTSEFSRKPEANFYFPLDTDFARLKSALSKAVAQCIRDQS